MYDKGYQDGIEAYAFMKEGIFYVGTTGRTLRDAIKDRKNTWNYNAPDQEPERLPGSFPMRMIPGLEPYTPDEQYELERLVSDAAEGDPGEGNEP